MALQVDPNSGLPLDPATLQQIQEQNLARQIASTGGNARERMNDMSIARGVNTLFPNAEMRQATSAQDAMRAAQLTQNDGESQLDFSIRQLQAQRDAVSHIDPTAASAMNTQLLKLGEMKFQQDRLKAQDQRTQETFDADAPARALESATAGYGYLAKVDKDGQLLSTQIFDASKPSETQDMQAQVAKDPTLRILSGKDVAALTRSQDSSDRKLAQQLLLEQMKQKAGLIPDETVAQYGFDSLINPTLLSRASVGAKAQLENFYNKLGMSTADQGSIRAEYKGMMGAVGNAAKREANMNMFGSELQQQQQVLLDAASKTDRGSIAKVNQLMSQGKAGWADSGPEAAYAAALQTYVNTYSRVVGGGTGVVSDSARREALAALSGGYLGPQGMKGATDMLSQKEVAIIRNASDATVELFTNPTRYSHLIAWQDKARKLGYNVATTSTDDSGTDLRSPPQATPINRGTPPAQPVPLDKRIDAILGAQQ